MKILGLDKLSDLTRNIVEIGFQKALEKGALGSTKIDSIQIENTLSGGRTNSVVFVAKYGILDDEIPLRVRVIKVTSVENCLQEKNGYEITRNQFLDIFSQLEYFPEDDFEVSNKKYGILLYQDVGTVSGTDLKSFSKYVSHQILQAKGEELSTEIYKVADSISLLLQKEVFLNLKRGLYGRFSAREINLNQIYGAKIDRPEIKKAIEELKQLDPEIPHSDKYFQIFDHMTTYYKTAYIHGDLNPENVLLWEDARGVLVCKIIDFGEVYPKRQQKFTPLFWDFSRLMGEFVLDYMEQYNKLELDSQPVYLLWSAFDAYLKKDNEKIKSISPKIGFIARIYFNTLHDFLTETKSGYVGLQKISALQDFFYCQIAFFIFFSKYKKESIFKRTFALKFAYQFFEYASSSEPILQQTLEILESNYYTKYEEIRKPVVVGPPSGSVCPYPGLSAFSEKDANHFFGRNILTKNLIESVLSHPITAVFGPSGSGKSSIVYAGLIPNLRKQGNWLIVTFRPGKEPIMALSSALVPFLPENFTVQMLSEGLTDGNIKFNDVLEEVNSLYPDYNLLIFIDQFEEIFTLCKNEDEKRLLISLLLTGETKIVFTMRADFLGKALSDPQFSDLLSDSEENQMVKRIMVGSMNMEELQSAIEKPAELVGLKFEDRLIERILNSIGNESGNLPLLEFCLSELWKLQVDSTLNHKGYETIGRVRGALATFAEQIYESLNEQEKKFAKGIFIQLVQPGQGTEDTRRIANIDEIGISNENLIQKLADLRLIVTNHNENSKQTTVEIIHEALIREWKRLRDWIESERKFRIWQEDLRQFIKRWEFHNKHESDLLRGINLVEAEDWLKNKTENISNREKDFIELSVYTHKLEQEKKETAKLTIERQKKRFWSVLTGFSGILILTIASFAYYLYSTHPETIMKNASNLKRWSKSQGKANWNDAEKKCHNLGNGWRLPTRLEWRGIFRNNEKLLKEKWAKEDGCNSDFKFWQNCLQRILLLKNNNSNCFSKTCYYWTGEEMDNNSSYNFNFNSKNIDIDGAIKNAKFFVRCIQ